MLDGIPPSARGVPQVEVTFDIDANGILHVSAKDKATNKEQKITITASTSLSKDEVERMASEAALHADEDKKKRELIDLKNTADSIIYQTEKTIKDNAEKIPGGGEERGGRESRGVKKVKDGEDRDVINAALEALNASASKIGAALYQQQPPSAPGGGEAGSGDVSGGAPSSGEGPTGDTPLSTRTLRRKNNSF